MKKTIITILSIILFNGLCLGQDANNPIFYQTYEVSTQITGNSVGRSNEILFNAYRCPPVNGIGWLEGSSKHSFGVGGYEGGAGAIRFLGNYGKMDFFISNLAGNNANELVDWGIPKMSILRNGNIGIGAPAPNSRLVVSDGLNGISFNPSGVNGIGFNRNVSDGAIFNPALSAWQFSARNEYFSLEGYNGVAHDLFTVLKNGNVGIGTIAPGAKLDVNGVIRTYNINNNTANWDNLSMWSDGAKSFIQSNGDESGMFIKSNGGNKIIFESNVGIGTSIPNSKLHVSAGFIDEANINYQGANMIIEATSTTRTVGQGAALGFVVPANADGSNLWQQGRILVTPDNTSNGNANGRMYIQARGWSTAINNWDWQNNLVLLSNGFVGIGTDSPDKELTVKGTIHAREVIVDMQGPLADYVFEPTYNLKPLAEVEKFVKEEKHLPEMPSAAEVADKGMNMGEMQNLLLQKVEELTLYLIEQQKVMQLQQAQMATQQTQMVIQQAQIDELKKQVAEKNMATK